uniref:ATP-dependent RNA helicase n=1 Tax=Strongyloides papillosus TaxID=174720 RepID=A0A0N5BX62_STREA
MNSNKYEDLHFTSDEEENPENKFETKKMFSNITSERNRPRRPFGYKPELREPERLIGQRQGMMAHKNAFEYNSTQTYYVSNEELSDQVDLVLQKNCKTFQSLNINKDVLKVLHEMNKNDMTAIQQYVCPLVKARVCNVIASAPTGFGKTYAYIVPIIDYIIRKRSTSKEGYSVGRAPLGMMMAITKDLAKQLMEDVKALTKGNFDLYNDEFYSYFLDTPFETILIYGDINNRDIQNQLEKGCDFVIACLGRLKSLSERKIIKLEKLRYLVVDEADKFISDPTYKYEMSEFIKDSGINNENDGRLIKILTSAVIDEETIHDIAPVFIPNSDYVFINHSKSRTHWNVIEEFILVKGYDKFHMLIEVLKAIKSKEPNTKIITFFGSRNEMDLAATWMNLSNIPNKSISGNRTQEMRDEALRVIDEVPGTILISTDVIERGIDVKGAKYVIHHNVPQKYSRYINRIGRVGRHEGSEGISIMFVTDSAECINDVSSLVNDMNKYNYNVPPKLLNYHKECEREKANQMRNRFIDMRINSLTNNAGLHDWANDINLD